MAERAAPAVFFGCLRLFIILLLPLFLAHGCKVKNETKHQAVTYRQASQEISLGSWERELPADIVLLLDQSGSMSKGDHPTDPTGLRATGSRSFVEFLAQRSSKEQPNRFGVVNFGSHAQRDHACPLTAIRSHDDPALQTIFAKLKELDLGDTNIIAAIRLGMQLLREGGSFEQPRNRALVLFTDGEPDDARNLSLAQYFAELSEFFQDQLKPSGVSLFVVGIDTVGTRWSATVPYWKGLAGSQYVFTTPNMTALKAQFNRIVQRIWHLPEVEPVAVSSLSPVGFELEPYLASVEFHIFPTREGLTLNVRRPNGKIVEPGKDPDTPPIKRLTTFDLLVVRDPEPGRWLYEVVGGAGTVEVLRNPIPLHMRLLSPRAIHPQGKPMRLIAEFRRTDEKPVPSHRDYPLALTAEITTPSGKRELIEFPLDKGRNGVYVGQPALEAPMELGEYQVLLKVSGGDRYHSDHAVAVQVKPVPYLLIDEPGEDQPRPPAAAIPLRVRLLQGGKPLKPQEAFTNHPDHLVIAQLVEDPEGQKGQAIWLSLAKEGDTPGQFVGAVPVPKPVEGRYILAVRLAPEEASKQPVADQTIIELVARRPPMPGWQKALWKLLGLAGAGLFALTLWLLSLPRASGGVEVLVDTGNGEDVCASFRLVGRKFRLIRIKAHSGIKGRWLFVNGTKRNDRVTVRFFHKGVPLWKHVTDGGEVRIGKHIVRYYA
ncbi:vWA domain-containing protein [Thermoanaerobaculum aquaticum]|uniref:vWA domain-containing protein n=1 Tax=Thermoanaerobaculum aquaticum TaxID=1312852 RepID=UPI001376F1DC|nr:vWA domain-containing protein [Thermoanaerobaculum aquaticum]